jgi:hypothetical protein
MVAIYDADEMIEFVSDTLIEDNKGWQKYMSQEQFTVSCNALTFEEDTLADAPIDVQQAFLNAIQALPVWQHSYSSLLKETKRIVMMTVLVERGQTFIYPADPLLLANGEPVPRVLVIPENKDHKPYYKSRGKAFNDENVDIWMTTVLMCTLRRGIRRISDIMRDVLEYVQCGQLASYRVLRKSKKFEMRGMRVCLPEGRYFPIHNIIGKFFYTPPINLDHAPLTTPQMACSPQALIFSIVTGTANGFITSGTHKDRLEYYANAMYNYQNKNPNHPDREDMQNIVRLLDSWIG